MTIAACYVCSEGVVFGADSTWTVPIDCSDGSVVERHLDYGQKVLQVGENSTLGVVMWGLVTLGETSIRTLLARLSDDLQRDNPKSIEEVARRWADLFWKAYTHHYNERCKRARELRGKGASCSEEESQELKDLRDSYGGGFFIGGHFLHERIPKAFEITYDPSRDIIGGPEEASFGFLHLKGAPGIVTRMLLGIDATVVEAIASSDKWTGTKQDVYEMVARTATLAQPANLPLREAVDWVYASLYTTIKVIKFTHLPTLCGGPIDIAIITTDRRFRWVRRKPFHAALYESQSEEF